MMPSLEQYFIDNNTFGGKAELLAGQIWSNGWSLQILLEFRLFELYNSTQIS